MHDLLIRPSGLTGKVHDITVESARTSKSPRWSHVGFGLYRLKKGETAAEPTLDREVIIVMVEGKARISGAGREWGTLGERMSVFEKTAPHCLYLPNGTDWSAVAETDCVIAICCEGTKVSTSEVPGRPCRTLV